MSIRFFHFAGILSRTTYSLRSPSILTFVPRDRPRDTRSADTATAFMPGVMLSPHAPTFGFPWPCFGSELNAVAVTIKFCCFSCGIFWRAEQEDKTKMPRRQNEARNWRKYISGYPLILSRSCREHLKVTTRLGSSIMLSPVAGFLPLLSRFSLTQNFPNPLIKTSLPDESSDLMSSRRVSINSTD